MEQPKRDIFHFMHAILGVYLMIGGFFPNPMIYQVISTIVITSWVIMNGRCILSNGHGYPKGSLMEQVFRDVGIEDGQRLFMLYVALSTMYSSYATGRYYNILALIAYKILY